MQNQEIAARLEDQLETLLHSHGLQVVDVQYLSVEGSMVLRVFIDNPELGVDIKTCEVASRTISKWLDEKDPIPSSGYLLEVSSPGIDRILKKDRDFERFQGSKIKVKMRQKLDGQRHIDGELTGYDSDSITVRTGEKDWTLPRIQIAHARLDPEL